VAGLDAFKPPVVIVSQDLSGSRYAGTFAQDADLENALIGELARAS